MCISDFMASKDRVGRYAIILSLATGNFFKGISPNEVSDANSKVFVLSVLCNH